MPFLNINQVLIMRIILHSLLPILTISFIASTSFAGEVLELDDVITQALKNNPRLEELQHKIKALSLRPDQAEALPNPMVSLGLMNVPLDTLDLDQEGMTQKTIGVMQTFPYPGKLALKREIAEKDLVSGKESLEVLKLRVVREVKSNYYSLFFTNKSIEITKRNKKLLEEFVRIAETKYSVGRGVQQDVLKAQVELSKLLEKLITLKEKRNTLKARLNYLMDRMPQEPLGDPGEVELTSLSFSVDELQKKTESEQPILKNILASIEKRRSAHLLAKKEYYPDFNVSVQYGQREDGAGMNRADFASAMVRMKVPLWYKTKEDKKVMEMAARIRQTEKNYEAAKSRLFFRIKKIKEEIDRNYEQALLFREGIIPQATASLDSAVAGYQVNKVDFLTLLDNQITLFNYEIEYYRTVAGHETKLAEMEEAVGVPISDRQLRSAEPDPESEVRNSKLDNEVKQ